MNFMCGLLQKFQHKQVTIVCGDLALYINESDKISLSVYDHSSWNIIKYEILHAATPNMLSLATELIQLQCCRKKENGLEKKVFAMREAKAH